MVVAPSIAVPDKDGYVDVQVINAGVHPIRIPLLTPVARFIVDPRVTEVDLEFTTAEILEKINVPDDLSPENRIMLTDMIASRRRLFATTLGWAHGYKQRIDTPKIDSGEVLPPAFPQRNRSPEE